MEGLKHDGIITICDKHKYIELVRDTSNFNELVKKFKPVKIGKFPINGDTELIIYRSLKKFNVLKSFLINGGKLKKTKIKTLVPKGLCVIFTTDVIVFINKKMDYIYFKNANFSKGFVNELDYVYYNRRIIMYDKYLISHRNMTLLQDNINFYYLQGNNSYYYISNDRKTLYKFHYAIINNLFKHLKNTKYTYMCKLLLNISSL